MNTPDVSTASPARIKELARYCNLKVIGTRGIWWVRKSATSPVTCKEYFFKRSTKTTDLRTAVVRAMPWVDDFIRRMTDPAGPRAASSSGATKLKDLFAAYRAAPMVKANADTREKNIKQLRRVVKLARGEDFPVDEAAVAIITKQLARDYQAKRLELGRLEHGEDLAGLEGTKRGINSTLKQAQSLFSREALDCYESLNLPAAVKDFAAALPVPARDLEEPVQLEDTLVDKIRAEMALHKLEDPAVWVTFQLFVWAGLRNIECLHARVSWFEKIGAGYRIKLVPDGDFIPKGRSTSRVMPAPIVEEILAQVALTAGGNKSAHIVPAENLTDRHDAIYRRLNSWLKNQGVTENAGKIAYRLRKYFFKKVEEQQGLSLALAAHGGGQLSTLTDHYTGRPQMAEPLKFEPKAAG